MKAIFYTTALMIICASTVMAKSAAPKEVQAIATEQAVFSAPHFGFENGTDQNGGVILAHDPKTKNLLWRIKIYNTNCSKELEKDVQDAFIKTLSFDKVHNLLVMSDEKSRVFVLNLSTKKVTQIE